jgi:hypothetical protein
MHGTVKKVGARRTPQRFILPECCRFYHRRTPPPPPHTGVTLDHPASKGWPLLAHGPIEPKNACSCPHCAKGNGLRKWRACIPPAPAPKAQSIADYENLLAVALYLHRLFLGLPETPTDQPAKAEAESHYATIAPLILTQELPLISIQRQKALANPSVNPIYENLARREVNSAIRKAIRRVEKTRAWQRRLFDDAATADSNRRIFIVMCSG